MKIHIFYNSYSNKIALYRKGHHIEFVNEECTAWFIKRMFRGKHWTMIGEL